MPYLWSQNYLDVDNDRHIFIWSNVTTSEAINILKWNMELPLRKLILFNAVVHIFAKKKDQELKRKCQEEAEIKCFLSK